MKKPYYLIIAASLALNVLLAGYIIGRETLAQPPHRAIFEEVANSNLTPEKKALIQNKMREFQAQNKERFGDIRAKRDEIKQILTAETFDVNAFKTKSKELDDLFTRSKKIMIDDIAEMAQTMSQEERKALAGLMRRKYMSERSEAPKSDPRQSVAE